MSLMMLIFGLASTFAIGTVLVSLIVRAWFVTSGRSREKDTSLVMVVAFSALVALLSGWGAFFWFDSPPTDVKLQAEWRRNIGWAVWAWPAGFILGGSAGALIGAGAYRFARSAGLFSPDKPTGPRQPPR